jgi:iron complex outermembrane receptor protein
VVLLAGLRYQGFHQTSATDFVFLGGPPTINPTVDSSAVTPRLGLLWQARPWFSIYVNGAGSYGPNVAGDIQADGQPAPPTRASQFEIGTKGNFLGDRLTATLAFFTLTKTNIPEPDVNPAFVDVIGAAQSSGIELDVQGALSRSWQIVANFADMSATVTNGTPTSEAPTGSPLGEVPRYTGRLWLTHDFAPPGTGVKAGFGVDWNGTEPYLYPQFTGLTLPAYTLVDAMASDSFKVGTTKVQLQLNASNIFNHKYFTDAQNQGPVSVVPPYNAYTQIYGSPFTITGAIRIQPK